MTDGSLKFDTKIDTDGFEKGTNTMKGMMERAVSSLKRAGAGVASAFSTDGASAKVRALVDEIDRYKDTLYYLEKRGLYFGDSEYDDTYQKLTQAESALSRYKKELASVDGEQKKVAASSRKMNSSLRSTIKNTVPLTKSIFKLSNMFKLLVLRMAMRAAIRSLQEGFKNLAQYSNQANKDMSALKTSAQTLQNSFATAFAPILTAVTPILQVLIRHLSDALSIMGQFFAVLFTGATTFTRAKDAQVDYAKSIKDTAKAANKALSPLDKLNVVASGTGDGYQGPSPGDMFEEVKVGQGIIDFVERAKNILKPVTTSLKNLKKALEPLSKFVFDNLKNFYNDFLKPIGKWILGEGLPRLLDVVAGLVSNINWRKLTDALKNLYEALAPFAISVGKGLILFIEKLAEILKPILATAADLFAKALNAIAKVIDKIPEEVAIAIGGAIGGIVAAILLFKGANTVVGIVKSVGKALGGFITTMAAHPLLTIATGLAAITGAILSLEEYRFSESDIGKLVQALKDYNNEVKTMIDDHDKKIKNIDDEHSAVKTVADKYFELADSTVELTDEQKTMLITYANQLADMTPEIEGLIDRQTGAYKGTREEIELAIDKSFEYMRVQAMQEYLIDLYKEQAKGKRKIAEAEEKLIAEEEKNARLREQYNVDSNGYIRSLGQTIRIITDDEKRLRKELEETKKIYGKVGAQIEIVEQDIINYGASTKDSMKKAKKEVDDALSSIEKKVKTFKLPTMEVKIGMNTSALEAFRKGTAAAGINVSNYPAYASGNVIPANYGNFLAVLGDNKREPEVVSPVSKIEEAVENVLNRRGGAGGGEYTFIAQIDGKTIFKETVKQDKMHIGQTGKSAFAY